MHGVRHGILEEIPHGQIAIRTICGKGPRDQDPIGRICYNFLCEEVGVIPRLELAR